MLAGEPARLVSATRPFSGLHCLQKVAECRALEPIQQFVIRLRGLLSHRSRAANSKVTAATESGGKVTSKPSAPSLNVERVRFRLATRHGVELRDDRRIEIVRRPHFLPTSFGVGVILVDPPDRGARRGPGVAEFELDRFRRDRMARQRVVGEKNRRRPLVPNDPGIDGRMRAFDRHHFGAECVQQFVGAVGRLGDAVNVEQAEAALKRHRRKIIFLEDIGESPIAVALNQTVRFHDGLGDEGRGVRLVMHRVARIGRRAPFRVIDRPVAGLASHLARFIAQHAAAAFRQLRFGVIARFAEGVGRIMVRADEVGRQLALRHKTR